MDMVLGKYFQTYKKIVEDHTFMYANTCIELFMHLRSPFQTMDWFEDSCYLHKCAWLTSLIYSFCR